MPEKPIGFTLVLDGNPDEVVRILDAVAREYQRLDEENWRRQDYGLFGRPVSIARSSLRGRIDLRYDAHGALLEEYL